MKTTVRHECEICGFASANETEVQVCENQGLTAKFQINQEVIVQGLPENSTEVREYSGIIAEIFAERKTHKLLNYNVRVAEGMLICVPEEDIRAATPVVP